MHEWFTCVSIPSLAKRSALLRGDGGMGGGGGGGAEGLCDLDVEEVAVSPPSGIVKMFELESLLIFVAVSAGPALACCILNPGGTSRM